MYGVRPNDPGNVKDPKRFGFRLLTPHISCQPSIDMATTTTTTAVLTLTAAATAAFVYAAIRLIKPILRPIVIEYPWPRQKQKLHNVAFCGSFNPPHNGHIAMILYLCQRYVRQARVWMIILGFFWKPLLDLDAYSSLANLCTIQIRQSDCCHWKESQQTVPGLSRNTRRVDTSYATRNGAGVGRPQRGGAR